MDVAVNKPAKDFMKNKFQEWYTEQVLKQLDGKDIAELETTDIQPRNLSMPVLKEVGAKWLVEMAEYLSDNPQFVVNGFIRSGITGALDRAMEEEEEDDEPDLTDEESVNSTSDSELDTSDYKDIVHLCMR